MENEMSPSPTLREINEHNRLFWEEQNALRDRRMEDESIGKAALMRFSSDLAQGFPFSFLPSIEKYLADAESNKRWFLSQQARRGGQAKKPDALGQLILDLVRRDPAITEAKLKDMLTRERFPGLIEDVDGDTIWFVQPDGTKEGRAKKAPTSGLKHRLSRAKKALESR